MRVLKVTQAYFPFLEKGGPAVKVRAIARGLARRGHQVTILTADLGCENQGSAGGSIRPGAFGWQAEEDGVEAVYLKTWGHYRAATFNPGVVSFCRSALPQFDLVHVYGLYDLLGAAVAHFSRRRGVPYVVEPMGMYRPIVRSIPLKRLYHRTLGLPLLRGAHNLIATSDLEKQELLEGGLPEARMIVRRNGIEVPDPLPATGSFRKRWTIAPDAKLILFLGRLVSKKSPDVLIEAFAGWRAGAGDESAVLVLAGPEEGDGYLSSLKALARRLGVEQNVLFTGPLYDDAKWAAYCDADVFVLPSQHENFGNTIGEAIACGTPVILTERCGIAPLVGQRAGMVVPHGAEPMQEALTLFFADPELSRRLRAGCLEVAPRLSWEQPLSQMAALYEQVVAEAAAR
jgi:glycosyltransferase involved in cell wall biosynthesis